MMTSTDDPTMRLSLQVAPLAIHKDSVMSDMMANSSSFSANRYSTAHMTPPMTPSTSNEDLHEAADVPAFQNFLRAFYPFQPSNTMVDSTVTLPLNEGDVVLVHSIHTNGWADGTLLSTGARGWLPTNYCEAYNPEEMRSLLKALLNFWDLLRSTAVNDNEIFGNQEFMKGIIAGVRCLLERSGCLTRESASIQRHDGLRRSRKSLLSELSSLVKTAKRLQEHQKSIEPAEDVNDIVDEMILKACKIVTKGVRFFDILDDDRRTTAAVVAVMETVPEESSAPPTPPADVTTHDGAQDSETTATVNDDLALTAAAAAVVQHTLPNVRRSSGQDWTRPASQRFSIGNAQQMHRLSSGISHRVSLAGPSPLSRPQNLVSERLTKCHDIFLSYVGSFIGRLHLQSQSRPHLAAAIEQSASSGKDVLVVVDVVASHSVSTRDVLELSRVAMYDRILDLVQAAREILMTNEADVAELIVPQDNGRLLTAATGCVRATGECVAKTKWVIETIGDFEFEFDEAVNVFDMDLGLLNPNNGVATEVPPMTESTAASDSNAGSIIAEPLPLRTSSRTAHHNHTVSAEKPLPLIQDVDATIIEESREVAVVDSLERPSLPPLRRLSTLLPVDETYSPVDSPDSREYDERLSYRPESLQASSSGASSYVRDSEASAVSQTSTRATTPDILVTPKNQPSLSALSTADSASSHDELEDFESRLLEKTYAQELMFNKEGQVTGGSLYALVERLTTHESTPDAMFVSTFYLTFRMFCTPAKLAAALIDRFEYVGESPHMCKAVRLRVYNVLKGWLESHWRDETDRGALVAIRDFAESKLSEALPSAGKRLLSLVERVTATNGTLVPRLVSSMGKTNTVSFQYVSAETPLPEPALVKGQGQLLATWKNGGTCPTILEFDPLEVARQLTIRQSAIFCSILPEELLGSQWMKKGGVESPNVKAMTALSTELSNLVADTILHHPEPKKRAIVIKQWIKIAYRCLELNNYDALMAILCSLSSSTITRLRRTWDMVSPKRREILKTLQAVVEPSQNHKALRTRLAEHVPPTLPFLGVFLTDLTFVDIGNPATKQLQGGDGRDLTIVNFDKHMRTAKIIGELQRFQIPYRLVENADMQGWLQSEIDRVRDLEPGANKQVQYYRKSLMLEPREATQRLGGNHSASSQNLFGWMRSGAAAA